MPKLEIDNNNKNVNEVLVDVPFGKTYLFEKPKDQLAQKEGTCWYYTLTYLRLRYGKAFPVNYPPRRDEMIISSYRKHVTEYGQLRNVFNILLESSDFDKDQTKEKLSQIQEHKHLLLATMGKNNTERLFGILDTFISQEEFMLLGDFVEREINNLEKESCQKVLTALGADFESITTLPSDIIFNYLKALTKQEVAKRYGLINSIWHPDHGITGLIEALRKQGACYVSALNGAPYYKCAPNKLIENFGKRDVYTWHEKDYVKNNNFSHAILVVGAKKTSAEESIYFIDPNHPNPKNGPHKLCKISYTQFIKNLNNFMGYSFRHTPQGKQGPYLHQANHQFAVDKIALFNQVRKSLKGYHSKLSPASLTLFSHKPVPELTPAEVINNAGLTDYSNLTPASLTRLFTPEVPTIKMTEKSDDYSDANHYSKLTPASLPFFLGKPARNLSPADIVYMESRNKLSNLTPASLISFHRT